MQNNDNIWFTSDHHFGHKNIIPYADRPLETLEEMNKVLIEKWNSKVKKNDFVYHLGDFALCNTSFLNKILDQLNGNVFLIKGNHDDTALKCKNRFEWIKDYHEMKVEDSDATKGKQMIVLMHYAMRVWNKSHYGSWQLFGHSHGNLPDKETSLSFDVGVDCHDFYPISYNEVKVIMSKKKCISPIE